MEDRDIVELYWQRSDQAIAETEAKYGRYCRTIAKNICGVDEDAEECVNDTWLHAWQSMPSARPAVLSAFLGRITRNLSINRIKTNHAVKRGGGETTVALDELSECLAGSADPARSFEEKELERAVGRFVQRLKEPDKAAFVLRYWYLAPIPEIARRLGCREGKVKSLLFRTRKRLGDYLQKEGCL